ncbi:MAG: cation:proton antiporter, partial [Dactylosporangium sp.]|nr:cation:proton antiporter [Dactylosporangium sp.]
MTWQLEVALLVAAAVLLVAVGAVRLSTRLGVPSLLFYLALGVVLGEAGIGIEFENADLTRTLGFFALVVIIAEGGLTERWSTLRPVLGLAAMLATVGVLVSVAVVGVLAPLLLGIDWPLAFLIG